MSANFIGFLKTQKLHPFYSNCLEKAHFEKYIPSNSILKKNKLATKKIYDAISKPILKLIDRTPYVSEKIAHQLTQY